MPLIDRRTDAVVLRIVYDGPPEAGKTTNLRQLCDRLSLGRRGPLESPGGGARTQFFDWLDVTGGYVAGRRLRCQLVTVPGQSELAGRRRHLLATADAVVFVVDSRPEALGAVQGSLQGLRRALARRAGIPLLVQANKQDVPGAVAAAALVERLHLEPDTPVIEAEAASGVGVLETFMLGVRLAVDRVRADLVRGGVGEGDAAGAAQLLEELRDLERTARAVVGELVAPAEEPERADAAEPTVVAAGLLPAADVAPGLVWPSQGGRATLRALAESGAARLERAGVVRCGSWRLFRAPQAWRDLDDARRGLLEAVSCQRALATFVPESRVLVVAHQAEREPVLWYVVEAAPSLASSASGTADERDDARRAAALLVEGVVTAAARVGATVEIAADTIALDGRRYLGPVWPGEAPGVEEAWAKLLATLEEASPTPLAERGDVLEIEEGEVDGAALGELELISVEAIDVPAGSGASADAASLALAAPLPGDGAAPRAGAALPAPAPSSAAGVAPGAAAPDEPPPCAAAPGAWELPGVELPAGMVWPPVRGRASLAALTAPVQRRGVPVRPWAHPDAVELLDAHGWWLHTSLAWCFADLDEARHVLVGAVRWQTRLGALAPEGRTLALCPAATGARLWVVTAALPSCWEQIVEARAEGEPARVREAVRAGLAALAEVRGMLARVGLGEEVALDVIAVDSAPRLLLTPPSSPRPSLAPRLAAQLAAIGVV